jgi:hypothetical protein
MALTYPQRGFAGAAVAGTISSPGLTAINGPGITFTSSSTLIGWTEIANGSWSGNYVCITFEYGTANEEKILCTFNSSTGTFTIVTRGYDGTSAVAHVTGSLFILTSTATEAAELNAVTQSMKNLLLTNGLSPLPADISTSAAALGISTKPSSADHTHKLTASTLNGWLSGSASGAINPAVTVYPTSINSGALPSGVTLTSNIASTQINSGALPSGVTLTSNIASTQINSGALPSGVTIPLSQITNPPAADFADSSANYAVTFTTTANALSVAVNPAGNHKQFVWRTSLSQQGNASGASYMDVKAIIRYRIVGAATWTNGTATTIGVCAGTNDYRCLSGGGVVTLGSADNYEFQIGFQTAITGYTVSINQIRLVVEGLN